MRALLLSLLLGATCAAQTQIDLNSSSKNPAMKLGASLPATCVKGTMFVVLSTPASLKLCSATNTWTNVEGGVPTTRAINVSLPLSGGGELSADVAISCPTCIHSSGSYSDPTWLTLSAAKVSSGILGAGRIPAVSGDATSTEGTTALTITGIQGRAVDSAAPASGQVLVWSVATSKWVPARAYTWSTGLTETTGTVEVDSTSVPLYSHGTADPSGACDQGSLYFRTDTHDVWWCTDTAWVHMGKATHAHAGADITSGQVALARGGTGSDLSATGAGFLKQATSGAVVTVAALETGDIPSLGASKITSEQLALARGGTGTDLSATGAGFLKQATTGAAVTVAALAAADLPDPTASTKGGLYSKTCASGDFVSTIGTTGAITCGTPAGGTSVPDFTDPTVIYLRDHFMSGGTTLSGIAYGALSWMHTHSGGDYSSYGDASTAWPHFGSLMLLTASSNAANFSALSFVSSSQLKGLAANSDKAWWMHWGFRTSDITDVSDRLGVCAAAPVKAPVEFIGVRFDTALSDTAYMIESRTGSSSTVDTSGITAETTLYHTLEIKSAFAYNGSATANKIWMRVDAGSWVSVCSSGCTITATLPSANMGPCAISANTTTAVSKMYLNFFDFYAKP